MAEVEKEKFRPGKEKVKQKVQKEKGKKPKIECNVNRFLEEISDRRGEIENWKSGSPFLGLLKMNTGILIKKEFFEDLIKMFDHEKRTIKINGDDHAITPADFIEIMDIKQGLEPLDFKEDPSNIEDPSYNELLNKFGGRTKNKDRKELYVDRRRVVNCLKAGSEESEAYLKRAYNLLALMRVLVPSGRFRFPVKYLHTIDTCHDKQWAQHFIDQMVKGIKSYKNSKALNEIRVGGCILFLQLFYMKKVSCFVPPSTSDVLLQSVTQDMVQNFVKQHLKVKDADASSSGAGNKKDEVLEMVHDTLVKRLRQLVEQAIVKIDDGAMEDRMQSSYLPGMLEALDAQQKRFFEHEGKSDALDDVVQPGSENVEKDINVETLGKSVSTSKRGGDGGEANLHAKRKRSQIVDKENQVMPSEGKTRKKLAKNMVLQHAIQSPMRTRNQKKYDASNELTKGDMQRVESAWSVPHDMLHCLRGRQELNTMVVPEYFRWLKKREEKAPESFFKCHFFHPAFYLLLANPNKGYNYSSVRRWTKVWGYFLSECDKIFVPVLVNNHWRLGVINIVDNEFQYLDSLGGNGDQIMENLAKYCADEIKDKKYKDGIDVTSWKKNNIKGLPLQKNCYDCGMFMLMYADFCWRREPNIDFDQTSMPRLRMKVALDLLNMRETEEKD